MLHCGLLLGERKGHLSPLWHTQWFCCVSTHTLLPDCHRQVLHQDLLLGEREEYNSAVGLATLWERSGGQLTPNMVQVVQQQVATAAGAAPAGAGAGAAAAAASGVSAYKTGSSGGGAVDVDEEEVRQTGLLLELRALWDQWAVQEQEMGHTGDLVASETSVRHSSVEAVYWTAWDSLLHRRLRCMTVYRPCAVCLPAGVHCSCASLPPRHPSCTLAASRAVPCSNALPVAPDNVTLQFCR